MKRIFILIITGIIVFFIDQYTKIIVDKTYSLSEHREIIPGFMRLTKTYNDGIVFGFFSNSENIYISSIITVISISALIALVFIFFKTSNTFFAELSITFIMAGAIGNIFDRIVRGKVIDFIELYYKNFSWPVFNFADTFISIGVIMLIINELWGAGNNVSSSI